MQSQQQVKFHQGILAKSTRKALICLQQAAKGKPKNHSMNAKDGLHPD